MTRNLASEKDKDSQLCERSIEYNQDLHLVFVDQEKAFDRVNRDKL